MNQICKGLEMTQATMKKVFNGEGDAQGGSLDPTGLIVSAADDWDTLTDIKSDTWEDVLASCKAWADAKEYGEVYCCQHIKAGDAFADIEPMAVKASEVVAQEGFTFTDGDIDLELSFYAQV